MVPADHIASLVKARRVIILGAPGSGKSTFARRLHQALKLPIYHLDDLYWRSKWQRTPQQDFANLQRELVANDRWIIDGNYMRTAEIRLPRADAVCIFDVPTITAFTGFVRRALRRAFGERDSLPLNVRLDESYRWRLHLDLSVVRTIFLFRPLLKAKLLHLISSSTAKVVVVMLKDHRQSDLLINALVRFQRENFS